MRLELVGKTGVMYIVVPSPASGRHSKRHSIVAGIVEQKQALEPGIADAIGPAFLISDGVERISFSISIVGSASS